MVNYSFFFLESLDLKLKFLLNKFMLKTQKRLPTQVAGSDIDSCETGLEFSTT